MEEEGRFPKLTFYMVVVLFAVISRTTAVDTIYAGQPTRDGETLVSAQETFELGFFSPGSSTDRYVGVWPLKNISSRPFTTTVFNWYAPLTNTSGEFYLILQGSLVVRYANGQVIWSSTGRLSTGKLLRGQLLDNGNFIIEEEETAGSGCMWLFTNGIILKSPDESAADVS